MGWVGTEVPGFPAMPGGTELLLLGCDEERRTLQEARERMLMEMVLPGGTGRGRAGGGTTHFL